MLYLGEGDGTGGLLKENPEDFVVMEITSKGKVLELNRKYACSELGETEEPSGAFTTFILQKRNWETIKAVTEIAKKTGRGRKSVSYSGTKDRKSVSVQLASIYGVEPESVMAVRLPEISINGAWKSNGTELGSNLGNRFSVKVREAARPGNANRIIESLSGVFPNYFDRQRFGYRLNNQRVGMAILRNSHEEAAMEFLTYTGNETDPESSEARSRLLDERDFSKALGYFPRHLRYERIMIEHISRYNNFANALRRLPRGILLMFVHSVEDLIFNMALEQRVKDRNFNSPESCGADAYGFPDLSTTVASPGRFPLGCLVGYETDESLISEYEKSAMESIGLSRESFKIRSMPEISMKGAFRPLLSPLLGLNVSGSEDCISLEFSIAAGSYATIFLNEITRTGGMELSSLLS